MVSTSDRAPTTGTPRPDLDADSGIDLHTDTDAGTDHPGTPRARVRLRRWRRPTDDGASLRAFVRWGLLIGPALLLGSTWLALVGSTRSPAPVTALVVGVLVAVAVAHLVTSGPALRGAAPWWPAAAALVLTIVAAVVACLVAPYALPTTFIGCGLALSALLMARGWRPVDGWALLGFILGLAVLLVVSGVPTGPAPGWRALLVLLVVAPILMDLSSFWMWWRVQGMARERELATELATVRERARIAAELHDIQGHSLHVIALRAELVERLVTRDPVLAAEHAAAVRRLAADALGQTRALVHGYRTGDIAAELRNAANVLESAGARVRVLGDPTALPGEACDVLAPLLREATTNVLRHSRAEDVEIRIERTDHGITVAITNDGVPDADDRPPGLVADAAGRDDAFDGGVADNGVAGRGVDRVGVRAADGGTGVRGLRERFAQRGGTVVAGPGEPTDPRRWTITATLPRPTGPTARGVR